MKSDFFEVVDHSVAFNDIRYTSGQTQVRSLWSPLQRFREHVCYDYEYRNAILATKMQGLLIQVLPPYAIRDRKRFRPLRLRPVFLKLR